MKFERESWMKLITLLFLVLLVVRLDAAPVSAASIEATAFIEAAASSHDDDGDDSCEEDYDASCRGPCKASFPTFSPS